MDGRYKEQKTRLANCGVPKKFYLIEETASTKGREAWQGHANQVGYQSMTKNKNVIQSTSPSLHNSDHGYKDLQFRPFCSEIATVDTFGGRYTQRRIVSIGFSDHLVVKPSKNPLNLATTIGFSDLDPRDGG